MIYRYLLSVPKIPQSRSFRFFQVLSFITLEDHVHGSWAGGLADMYDIREASIQVAVIDGRDHDDHDEW